jgi:hypothetical protein
LSQKYIFIFLISRTLLIFYTRHDRPTSRKYCFNSHRPFFTCFRNQDRFLQNFLFYNIYRYILLFHKYIHDPMLTEISVPYNITYFLASKFLCFHSLTSVLGDGTVCLCFPVNLYLNKSVFSATCPPLVQWILFTQFLQ